MKFRQAKLDCRLERPGGVVEGLAHVVEVAYSAEIHFCNFVMQVTADQLGRLADLRPDEPGGALVTADGRRATVKVFHFKVDADYFHLSGAGMFHPPGGSSPANARRGEPGGSG
jgi:hypothetical protein